MSNPVIDREFVARGFLKAGGEWGEAQWGRVAEDLVLSVGQEVGGTWPGGEFSSAPANGYDPCAIFAYFAPFDPAWTPEQGESPLDPSEMGDPDATGRFYVIGNITLEQALRLIDDLEDIPALREMLRDAALKSGLEERS